MRSFSRELPLKTEERNTIISFLTGSVACSKRPTLAAGIGGYLEGSWLEAGLADGDSTRLGEEYGEAEGPSVDKKLLFFCDGDLRQAVT